VLKLKVLVRRVPSAQLHSTKTGSAGRSIICPESGGPFDDPSCSKAVAQGCALPPWCKVRFRIADDSGTASFLDGRAFIDTNPTNEPITSGLLLVTRDNRHGFRYGHIYSIDDFPGSGR
jgi:hypothetical protein